MILSKIFNINISSNKNISIKSTHLNKTSILTRKSEWIKIIKRFYPGHADKILAVVKSKIPHKPPTNTSVSNYSSRIPPITPTFHTPTPKGFSPNPNNNSEELYTKVMKKEFNGKFDSSTEKAVNNTYPNVIEKDSWDIVNAKLSQIIQTGIIPTIEELKDMLKTLETIGPLPENKKICYKELKKFLESKNIILTEYPDIPIINNPEIEKICRKTLTNNRVYDIIWHDFFKLNYIPIEFIEEDFNYNLLLLKKAYHLLENYSNISNEIFILILNQLKLSTYPDAIVTQNKDDNTSTVIKNGEGLKLDNKIYKIISTNSAFKVLDKNFPPDSKQFLDVLQNNRILGGITICDPTNHAIILSGPDLHAILAIEDFSDPNFLLVFAMLTSTKDENTILLTNKQLDLSKDTNVNYQKLHPKRYENDFSIYFPDYYLKNNDDKAQMIRFNNNLIRLPKKDFEELPKATAFSNTLHIRQKILTEIIPFAEIFCKNPYEKIFEFTKENLLPIVQQYVADQLLNLLNEKNKYLTKLESLPQIQKEMLIKEKQSQKNNQFKQKMEKTYHVSLPKGAQLLKEILNKLELFEQHKAKTLKKIKTQENIEKYNKNFQNNSNKTFNNNNEKYF